MAARGSPDNFQLGQPVRAGTGLPDSMISWIIALYESEGASTYRIAKELGIDRQRVTRALHRAGVEVAPRGRGRPKEPRVDNQPSATTLRSLYVDGGMTTPAIGRFLGMSDRSVRSLLARYGIERRHRGSWDRQDRIDVGPDEVADLYVRKELSAKTVGCQLGVSGRIVLRAAHSHGLPVRPGGLPSPATGHVQLLQALYRDQDVKRVLLQHRIPIVRSPGTLSERFPRPAPLSEDLLRALYVGCGLSSFQIELVTGQPSITILRKLCAAGIDRRPSGGLSPFMRRWRNERTSSARG